MLKTLDHVLSQFVHQPIVIKGPIHFSFLPKPHVYIHKIEMGSEPTPTPYFIQLYDCHFALSITALFKKKLLFHQIDADRFYIKIQQHHITPLATHPISISALFNIHHMLLKHGSIEYIDPFTQTQYLITQAQLGAQNMRTTYPFPVQLKGQLLIKHITPRLSTIFNFKGLATIPNSITDMQIMLHHIQLSGQYHTDAIHIHPLTINKVQATLQYKNQNLLLHAMTAQFYQGELFGELQIDFKNKKLYLNQTATHVDGERLLNTITAHNKLSGHLDFSVHTQLHFDKPLPLKTLHGHGHVALKDGEIHGLNLQHLIHQLQNDIHLLIQSPIPTQTPSYLPSMITALKNPSLFEGSTSFKTLSMQYRLQQDTLYTSSFIFQNEYLDAHGQGSYHFLDQTISTHLSIRLDTPSKILKTLQQAVGGYFIFNITGPIMHPTIKPAMLNIIPVLKTFLINKMMQQPIHVIEKQLQFLLTFPHLFQQNDD